LTRGRRNNSTGGSALSSVVETLRGFSYSTPAYRLSLNGRTPDRILLQPTDMLPGDTSRGDVLLSNTYNFGGQEIIIPTNTNSRSSPINAPWKHFDAGEFWYNELHSFEWLRDLKVIANQTARVRARNLIIDWIESHTNIDPKPWRADLIGRRISAWLSNSEFLLKDSDTSFLKHFFYSLALQARHLSRIARTSDEGLERLYAYKGMLYAGLSLPDGEKRYLQAIKLLNSALTKQVLPDGGYYERSPSTHLTVMRQLIDIQKSLIIADQPPLDLLNNAISMMASVLRTYRHGDGSLALFNSSIEEEPWLVDLVLTQSNAKGRAPENVSDVGFRRIQAGRTILITDHGAPAKQSRRGHAGLLSFELSTGKERLIVNCGCWRGKDEEWSKALRATAAHSTLTVNDTNSCELFDDGSIGVGPKNVPSRRDDQDGASWLEANHDGYCEPFGLMHNRRLYVSNDGTNVRGEDVLTRVDAKNQGGRSFAIRFHLHPDTQAMMAQDGASILLRQPSGNGWQMRSSGGTIGLNESIYIGDGATLRRSEQVIITGPVEAKITTIKWALRRISKN